MSPAWLRWLGWGCVAAVLGVSFVLGGGQQSARAVGGDSGGSPVKITVRTTNNGFEPNEIEVEYGQLVELTFVWDNPDHPLDEHIMVIEGYDLTSEKINSEHKETTLRFIANKPGTFTFRCDIQCDLHQLMQNGQLKVSGGSGGSASLQPAKIVADQNSVSVWHGVVNLSVALADEEGEPIPRSKVVFYAERQFLDRAGRVEIGSAVTDETGRAAIRYRPTTPEEEKLVVRFPGGGVFDAAELALTLPADASFGPVAADSGGDNFHRLKSGARYSLAVMIGGVWVLFIFVLFEAWRISRAAEDSAGGLSATGRGGDGR